MDGAMSSQSRETSGVRKVPRAVIHKKILDAAQSYPNASIEELATTVNGASKDLIERVLDEYGDPAESDQTADGHVENEGQSDMSNTKTNGNTSDADTRQAHETDREPVEVTEKQREALHAIRNHPDATQRDLAERFDVTQSTINNRLNSIEGFDWKHRQEFVESMFDDDTSPHQTTSSSKSMQDETTRRSVAIEDLTDQLEDLAAQVATLEQRIDERSPPDRSPFGDPDLASKIVRACMKDDTITEDEELKILKNVIAVTGPSE